MSSNTIIEEINSITSAGTFAVAHCVSEDFQMSRGVAVQFKLNYGHVSVLLDQRVRVGGVAELRVDQKNYFYIFYLVTKVLYHHKPTLQSLATTLVQLRDRLKELSISSLIIPKLGCKLDERNWYQVHDLLKTTFNGSDGLQLKVTVCDPENFQIPSHHLAKIEKKPIDFFNGSTNSTVKILPVEITCALTNTLF
ncbi:ADP-ribose glycohydrolase OARD1-like [Metopolophium dirhodum]|uniref:ADP-ribose glycohydrolase OARD1-like n=1 Tax=Metopolophium dirhodum TaxID=44670 RepID=UPI00298F50E0|nr:ADP-ribose glycohydrolase OARD1-like [Metopolophium dirhodum]